jgi:hypothetical protein
VEQHYIGTAHAVLSHRPADLASCSFVRTSLLAPAARPARRRRRGQAEAAGCYEPGLRKPRPLPVGAALG